MRGNLVQLAVGVGRVGSIPACAGEPGNGNRRFCEIAVYPRVCGGTHSPAKSGGGRPGLSPRVRGNRLVVCPLCTATRSIPACAGEPRRPTAPGRGCWVYPRVCGGTHFNIASTIYMSCLSPRVRGNPLQYRLYDLHELSIPACAGEPPHCSAPGAAQQVYPRVCGGTSASVTIPVVGNGLSPRVRGNRAGYPAGSWRAGSIPACAGEPC